MAYLELENVSVDLPIYEMHGRSLKRRMGGIGRRNSITEDDTGVVVIRALDNINLQLREGDRVGLVGGNGAGKSTLLRVLAGIYPPTSGALRCVGRSVPLLDIMTGMDDQSTGYQNIRLRGLLLGMSDAEIRQKTEEIAEFSSLDKYLNLPIRTYSSGMRIRLAFAISTAVDADILLLDEVVGVGDAAFRGRANARLLDLQNRAKIVVIASHANDVIRDVCNKALWLDGGCIRASGPVDEVIDTYMHASSYGAKVQ